MGIGIVETKKGKVSGIEKEGYSVFLGIPYAKPPVGNLRWKAPEELPEWEGILAADHFANRAMQMDQDGFYFKEFYSEEKYETPMSEDCLYLNIWTPAETTGEKLPVAFYIHGGAFFNGYGHEKEFDGEAFCRQGVILVTCNYRLGVLGFLVHPWLREEEPKGLAGNYGIRDQIAALTWVYENIAAFGGDPQNITVFGQSAGCMSTQTLVSSHLTDGMIAKAIFQSGGGLKAGLSVDLPMEEAESTGIRFASMCGAKSLEELRALPMEAIRVAARWQVEESMKSGKGLPYIPVIDGDVLKGGYDELAFAGEVKQIPYMLGTNKNDLMVTEEMLKKGEHSSLYEGCIRWSQLMEKQAGIPGYVYYFARDLQGDEAGAFHSAELWYVFGTLDRCWRPKEAHDYDLSFEMTKAWADFMKTGNPAPDKEEDWKPCTMENPYVKIFQ